MYKRPKIKLKLNKTDKILEIIGWVFLLGIWIFTIANYSELPEKIATHSIMERRFFGRKETN